jgi:hypothetical protein
VAGVISAADEMIVELFSGLSARQFAKLVRQLRREGAEPPLKGRPWKLAFEDRVLLVAAYWRTNLTIRQIAACSGPRNRQPTGLSMTSPPNLRSGPASGSPPRPCSSWTAP